MKNTDMLPNREVRGRRNAPHTPHNRTFKKRPSPRPFDPVAYAAAIEVLG
jgi:hypothetical protein